MLNCEAARSIVSKRHHGAECSGVVRYRGLVAGIVLSENG